MAADANDGKTLEQRLRVIEDRLEIYNLIASHPPSADTGATDYTASVWTEDDPQVPHQRDELYFVAAGTGRYRVEDRVTALGPGDLLFCAAHVAHGFKDTSPLHPWAPAFAGATEIARCRRAPASLSPASEDREQSR